MLPGVCQLSYRENQLAEIAGQLLNKAGDIKVWTFTGNLGAGKTTLIKEICRQLGSRDTVTSPTYAIANQYLSEQGDIYHIDAYRLDDEEEAFDAGVDEMIHSGAYCFIEWPKKISHLLPEHYLSIDIQTDNDLRILEYQKL